MKRRASDALQRWRHMTLIYFGFREGDETLERPSPGEASILRAHFAVTMIGIVVAVALDLPFLPLIAAAVIVGLASGLVARLVRRAERRRPQRR